MEKAKIYYRKKRRTENMEETLLVGLVLFVESTKILD